MSAAHWLFGNSGKHSHWPALQSLEGGAVQTSALQHSTTGDDSGRFARENARERDPPVPDCWLYGDGTDGRERGDS